MWVLGGKVQGGKVYGNWPGLSKEKNQLDGGDLKVTTDYRDVLSEIITRRLKNPHLVQVFPDYTPHYLNLLKSS